MRDSDAWKPCLGVPWPLVQDGADRDARDAGGCFWGTELAFQRVPGVVKTAVGYTQGQTKGPSYDAVCGGRTGHTEGVLVSLRTLAYPLTYPLKTSWRAPLGCTPASFIDVPTALLSDMSLSTGKRGR